MKKIASLIMLLSTIVVFTGEVALLTKLDKPSFFAPKSLGSISVFHGKKGFQVLQNGKKHKVQSCWTDKNLRNISPEKLAAFLSKGYISVKQMSDGEFKVVANTRGLGGGPITGGILYWATKSLCYGTAAAGATTAVVATGGAAGAATGALVAGTSAGLSTGATVVGGAIAGAGLSEAAAVGTLGVVTSAGGIAGAIAAVESASLAACAFGNMLLFLP